MDATDFRMALKHTTVLALGCAGFLAMMTPAAQAVGKQCAPRVIAENIKEAVLAMKATEYCFREDLPYTPEEVARRIESLRCGPESSALLDELLNDFDQQYKTILTRDTKHIVCAQAVNISFDD